VTPLDLFRKQRPKIVDAARDAAAAEYAARHEILSENASDYRAAGSTKLARDAAHDADIVHRAGVAEEADPEPRANLRESYCCLPCHVWYTNVRQNA